jgi:hypothetical protein
MGAFICFVLAMMLYASDHPILGTMAIGALIAVYLEKNVL